MIEKILENDKRQELKPGARLKLPFRDSFGKPYTEEVRIKRKLEKGEGSTCLAYEGEVLLENGKTSKVILKEFYPRGPFDSLNIRREQNRLLVDPVIQNSGEYQARRKQFERGCRIQETLSNSDIMEVVVRQRGYVPYGEYGDSCYVLSDVHKGHALKLQEFQKLDDKIELMVMITELVDILHDDQYLFVDLCPENLLWVRRPKAVKILDVDSIIDLKEIDSVRRDDLSHRSEYDSREMKLLKRCIDDFDDKKKNYLDPASDIYRLGILFFQLLFGRFPSDEEKKMSLKSWEFLQKELSCDEDSEKMMQKILKKTLEEDRTERYDSSELLDALLQLQNTRKVSPHVTKKELERANASYVSYHLLEEFPVYDYSRLEEGKHILDISIVGCGPMRTALIQSVISCVQMLDGRLNVRILSGDAKEFWEEFSSENCCPELKRTVSCTLNGTLLYDCAKDGGILQDPLAYIYLYTDDSDRMLVKIRDEEKSGYFVLLNESDAENVRQAKMLVKGRGKRFVGYLQNHYSEEISGSSIVSVYPISGSRLSEKYDEQRVKSHVYEMGLDVHQYYTRGNNPRAKIKDIRADYRKNPYYIESSERSALHGIYKLKSVGIDRCSPNAAQEYYRKVLSSDQGEVKENFDRLAALEHRSWTAFMVLHGARSVDKREDFRNFAYIADNTWKDISDCKHIRHPFLKDSRPGRSLPESGWEKCSEKEIAHMDPMDQWTLIVYEETERIIRERKGRIAEKLAELQRLTAELRDPELSEKAAFMTEAKNKCLAKETSAREIWNDIFRKFQEECREKQVYHLRIAKLMEELNDLMRPMLQYENYHDFKSSDEDIIRALPRLLLKDQKYMGKSTVIKPISHVMWENIYSTLMIEPDILILVTDQEEANENIRREYEEFLRSRGLETEVLIKGKEAFLRMKKDLGMVFVDETGVRPVRMREIQDSPYVKRGNLFEVKNRVLFSTDGNHFVEIFNRSVELSVKETFRLFGAELISEKKSNPVASLLPTEYKSIWGLYCDLESGKKWQIFIENLIAMEKGKERRASLSLKGQWNKYSTGYIEIGAIRSTKLNQVLEVLTDHQIIRSLEYTDETYPSIVFETEYPAVAQTIIEMTKAAEKDPLKYLFSVKSLGSEEIVIGDLTLYAGGVVPHKCIMMNGVPYYQDVIMKEILSLLVKKYKDMVFRNIEWHICSDDEEKNGLAVSFRYNSEAVREVLRKEGSILEALIYFECKRQKIFDDIRINVAFTWPDGLTWNEIDIVGTKKAKAYFISAKMTPPVKSHLEEADVLSRTFGVEGMPILVCSNYSTGKNTRTGQDFANRPYAVEQRSRSMKVGYIGRDEIIQMDKNGNRTIIVGDSIRKYVE